MARYLATFSGVFGDILWSLPTVKCISEVIVGEKLDFGMMMAHNSLIPFLEQQPYIDKAFGVEGWTLQHDNYGAQPWNPPATAHKPYERCWDLAYRCHPGIHRSPIPLIDFIAEQQGLKLKNPYPFLFPRKPPNFGEEMVDWKKVVAYSFNTQYQEAKKVFLERLKALCPELTFLDVQHYEWREMAYFVQKAMCFVGCRSSNNVVAHGVGQKNIFIYEPHPSRHAQGNLGYVFGSPYLAEVTAPLLMPAQASAEVAASTLKGWYQQREQEISQCVC